MHESTALTPDDAEAWKAADEAERQDVSLGLMLYNKGKDFVLAEKYKDDLRRTQSSLAFSALTRLGRFEEAASLLDRLEDSEENRLRRKSLGLMEQMQSPLEEEPRVHVLLLSRQRVDMVAKAVNQLAMTNYRNWAMYIADNGSDDGTWEELNRAVASLPDFVEVHAERFPTNIGRPAGHNWLLDKYDHSGADFIAIADDDLFAVNPEWISDMVKTMRLFPQAAAVGTKAYGDESPRVIHGAVRRILLYEKEDFEISHGACETDWGQYDYIDMVDHVIGCLHMYRRSALFEDGGNFDIGLSPCQRVDVEHHLRLRMLGHDIIYNGYIGVGHLRAGGGGATMTGAAFGNVLGNQIKMLYKHDPKAVQAAMRLWRAQRLEWLASA